MSDLVKSKRFIAAVAGVIVVVAQHFFPDVSAETVTNVVMVISAWIIGETFRPVVQSKS